MNIKVYKNSMLTFGEKEYRCIVGKNGLTTNKLEGDKKTPVGKFKISHILFRGDRLHIPQINLKTKRILPHDGWCDDPINIKYNQAIKFPFSGNVEKLYRDDCLYDIVCIIEYNTNPIISGKGSAIFFHLYDDKTKYTNGCVAVKRTDMIEILEKANNKIVIDIIDENCL